MKHLVCRLFIWFDCLLFVMPKASSSSEAVRIIRGGNSVGQLALAITFLQTFVLSIKCHRLANDSNKIIADHQLSTNLSKLICEKSLVQSKRTKYVVAPLCRNSCHIEPCFSYSIDIYVQWCVVSLFCKHLTIELKWCNTDLHPNELLDYYYYPKLLSIDCYPNRSLISNSIT